jgi:hypothetical protein
MVAEGRSLHWVVVCNHTFLSHPIHGAVCWSSHGLDFVRMSLQRGTWRWWWSHSSVMKMAWSERRGTLVLAALQLWQPLDCVWEAQLGHSGRLSARAQCADASGRKLSAPAPTMSMPGSVVTLLGRRRCGYLPRGTAPGENPRPRGLDGGGAMCHYPLGGVVMEP